MFDFLPNIKKGIAEISSGVKSLRKEIETKKRQREDLMTAPISRKELADSLCAMVDTQAQAYIRRLELATNFLRNTPLHDFGSGAFDIIGTRGNSSSANDLPRENAMWLLGDLLKQRIRDAVDVMDWPDSPIKLSRVERIKAIEKLDAEIAELREREKAIMHEAHAAGINL